MRVWSKRFGGGQLGATLTLSKYSLIAMLRSPTSVVFSLLFPIFFIIVFGSLVGDKSGPIKVAVAPGCDTAGPVYKAIEQIPSVELDTRMTAAQIPAAMQKGTITAVLNIVNDAVFSPIPHYRVTLSAADSVSRGMQVLRTMFDAAVSKMDRRIFPRNPTIATLSVARMPGHLHKAIDFILPLTFFVDGLRKIAFDGLHIWEMPLQVGGLCVWTVIIGLWAVRAFRWE